MLNKRKKTKVYFAKLFSSAYVCTVENNFAKSKQPRGVFDKPRAVIFINYAFSSNSFSIFRLAVDQVFLRFVAFL